MEKISIDEVLTGMKSALTVYNTKGIVLVDAGAVINDLELELLKKEKIPGLYICDDTVSDIAYPFLITIETRISLVNFLKTIEKNLTPENKEILVNNYLTKMIDELSINEEIEVVPPEIRSIKSFDIFHRVNVCILSLLTAIKTGFNKEELTQLALLILTSPKVVFEEGNENIKFKEVINTVKEFDLMVSGKDFNKNLPAFKALRKIVSEIDKKYKKEIVEAFLKVVAPYPLGSRVKLNTGDVAVVMDINKTSIYKPIVRVIGNRHVDNNYNEIDLLKHDTYVIVDVIF